jgi:hypothetical protein
MTTAFASGRTENYVEGDAGAFWGSQILPQLFAGILYKTGTCGNSRE